MGRGGGSKAVWYFSKKTSSLDNPNVPNESTNGENWQSSFCALVAGAAIIIIIKKKWPGKLRTYAPLRQKETKRRKRRNNHHYPAHTLQRPLSSSSENTKILNQTFNAVSHISKSTISEPKSYPFNWKCDIVIEILWEECSSFRGITSNFTAEILRLI